MHPRDLYRDLILIKGIQSGKKAITKASYSPENCQGSVYIRGYS
jgi:hypothetical protein